MNISEKGLSFVKKFEGFSSVPYQDIVGIWTIGYGNTYYENKIRVTAQDPPITEERATQLLKYIVKNFEKGVNEAVKSKINQNQFDALISFSYNLGVGNLKSSTLLKKVNINPNDPTIKEEFKKWNKAGDKEVKGLTIRRNEESNLYFS